MHLFYALKSLSLRRFLAAWLMLCLCGLCCAGTCLPLSAQSAPPPANDPHACCRARTGSAHASAATPDAAQSVEFAASTARHSTACCLAGQQKIAPKRFVALALPADASPWRQPFVPIARRVVSKIPFRDLPAHRDGRHLYLQHCLLLI